MKKWSSLPILHFAIFHHFCHETEHSTFILQPNKKLSKGNLSFLQQFYHFSSSLLPTILRSQSSFSFPSSWPHTLFEMRMGRWGEKPRRNTPPRCQYSGPGWMRRTCDTPAARQQWLSSDLIQIRFWTPRTLFITPTARQFASQTQLRQFSDIWWCDCEWRVESSCILLDQNSFLLFMYLHVKFKWNL